MHCNCENPCTFLHWIFVSHVGQAGLTMGEERRPFFFRRLHFSSQEKPSEAICCHSSASVNIGPYKRRVVRWHPGARRTTACRQLGLPSCAFSIQNRIHSLVDRQAVTVTWADYAARDDATTGWIRLHFVLFAVSSAARLSSVSRLAALQCSAPELPVAYGTNGARLPRVGLFLDASVKSRRAPGASGCQVGQPTCRIIRAFASKASPLRSNSRIAFDFRIHSIRPEGRSGAKRRTERSEPP